MEVFPDTKQTEPRDTSGSKLFKIRDACSVYQSLCNNNKILCFTERKGGGE